MKKYMKPELNVVKVTVEYHIMDGSPNATLGDGSVNANAIESRRGSYWDDDEY